jgi:simple sugar transport system ATP-binding protein
MMGSYKKSATTLDQLTSMMAGGAELEELSHELQALGGEEARAAADLAKELAADVKASV